MKEKGRTRWRRDRQEWRIGRSKKKLKIRESLKGQEGKEDIDTRAMKREEEEDDEDIEEGARM